MNENKSMNGRTIKERTRERMKELTNQ